VVVLTPVLDIVLLDVQLIAMMDVLVLVLAVVLVIVLVVVLMPVLDIVLLDVQLIAMMDVLVLVLALVLVVVLVLRKPMAEVEVGVGQTHLEEVAEESYLKPFESIVQVAPSPSRVVMRLPEVPGRAVETLMATLVKLVTAAAVAAVVESNCFVVILPQFI
jgi:hypothetical protein